MTDDRPLDDRPDQPDRPDDGAPVDAAPGLWGPRLTRSFFAREVSVVAADLLGRVVRTVGPQGSVAVRLTEVEAYAGPLDPASHAFRGRTPRTAVMFGPAGHLYTYFVYGMHWCANLVTGPDGEASAVLLRAGEVVDGAALARRRRPATRRDEHLARGPAGLAAVLGWGREHNGADLCGADLCGSDRPGADEFADVRVGSPPSTDEVAVGPRVGVSQASEVPWRYWIRGAPSVSAYRAGTRARRAATR